MNVISTRLDMERRRRRLWLAEGAAYLLAALIHLGLWGVFLSSQNPQVEPEKPPVIEVSLVAAKTAPAPASSPAPTPAVNAPAPPPPQIKPAPPKPKPVPKPEKPVVKKVEPPKPKPEPTPKHQPEPKEATESRETPHAEERAEPSSEPSAPAHSSSAHSASKASGESAENTRFTQGMVGGYRTAYPAIARQRGWEGTATVKIHVSADGEIEDVTLVASSGHDVLDDYAVEAVKGARHVRPCHRGDKPVDCSFTQPFQFKLTNE